MRPWRPWRTFWRPADMTHDELLAVLRPTGLPWAYHHWEGKQAPPYGVYLDTEDDPFFADNQTYTSFRSVRLEVYSLERDPALRSCPATAERMEELFAEAADTLN